MSECEAGCWPLSSFGACFKYMHMCDEREIVISYYYSNWGDCIISGTCTDSTLIKILILNVILSSYFGPIHSQHSVLAMSKLLRLLRGLIKPARAEGFYSSISCNHHRRDL